jgi:hypothetical protein
MKDFTFWRGSIYNAKTPLILKYVGEELGQFQNQPGLFGDGEEKLTDHQVRTLRLEYSFKIKKFESEAIL